MMGPKKEFDKYGASGAYHWKQTDLSWYNKSFNAPLLARYTVLLNKVPTECRKILDVGCGDGLLIYLLEKRGRRQFFGVDYDFTGLKCGIKELSKVSSASSGRLLQSAVNQLPFPDSTFDCITMADVIEHLEKPVEALKEAFRILKKNGILLLSTPNFKLDRVWDRRHFKEFTPGELKDLLSELFSDIEISCCWKMSWFNIWQNLRIGRRIINSLTRLGYNPFETSSEYHAEKFGQLVAICKKS